MLKQKTLETNRYTPQQGKNVLQYVSRTSIGFQSYALWLIMSCPFSFSNVAPSNSRNGNKKEAAPSPIGTAPSN
jgi:hypothetical protein